MTDLEPTLNARGTTNIDQLLTTIKELQSYPNVQISVQFHCHLKSEEHGEHATLPRKKKPREIAAEAQLEEDQG